MFTFSTTKNKFAAAVALCLIVVALFAPFSQVLAADESEGNSCINWAYGGTVPVPDVGKCVQSVLAWIAYIMLFVSGWIVWLAGLCLNFVMKYTLVDMKTNLDGIRGINIAWRVFRDVANMLFIFVLLWIALSRIFEYKVQDANRALKNIIIVALILNFSLFFTKVVIDASNIVAIGFYNGVAAAGAVPTSSNTTINPGALTSTEAATGIANAFMSPLGLSTVFKATDAEAFANNPWQTIIIAGVAGSFFFLTTAFTLLMAAVMFIIRYVVIIMLLVFSPLAFLSLVLPGTKGNFDKWLDALIGQAVFAPLYMMALWVALLIVQDPNFTNLKQVGGGQNASLGNIFAAGQGGATGGTSIGMVINFFIVIALLNAALIIAKGYATRVGGAAGKWVDKGIGMGDKFARKYTTGAYVYTAERAGQAAGTATLGTAAYVGRQTVGRAAQMASESKYLKETEGSKYAAVGYLGKAARKGLDNVAGSSFDARSAGPLKETFKDSLGKAGGKGGFKKWEEETVKEAEKRAKSLELNDAQKRDYEKQREAGLKRLDEIRKEMARGGLGTVEGMARKAEAERIKKSILQQDKNLGLSYDDIYDRAKKAGVAKHEDGNDMKKKDFTSALNRINQQKKEGIAHSAADNDLIKKLEDAEVGTSEIDSFGKKLQKQYANQVLKGSWVRPVAIGAGAAVATAAVVGGAAAIPAGVAVGTAMGLGQSFLWERRPSATRKKMAQKVEKGVVKGKSKKDTVFEAVTEAAKDIADEEKGTPAATGGAGGGTGGTTPAAGGGAAAAGGTP